MGSSLRRFTGITSLNMYKLIACSFLALAAGAPLEDTPEVVAAKAEFAAAFAAAEAGEHAALRPDAAHPVNSDVQAAQIASAYLDDIEDVAAAKAAFQAAFDDAAPAVAGLLPYAGLPYAGLPYNTLGYAGLGYNTLGYAGLGHHSLGYAGLGYYGLGYHGLGHLGFPY